MSEPISVDTALISSRSFQQFRKAITETLRLYDTGSSPFFPFGENLTDDDIKIITPIIQAHPEGRFVLELLLGVAGGDMTKVDLMSKILANAEDENTDLANFNRTPGTDRH